MRIFQKKSGGNFVDIPDLSSVSIGDTYRFKISGGWHTQKHSIETKESIERLWRDGELLRTDELLQPDRVDYQAILSYRAQLRDYPAQPDFPNGTRPAI